MEDMSEIVIKLFESRGNYINNNNNNNNNNVLENETSLDFCATNELPNLGQTTSHSDTRKNKKKKKKTKLMNGGRCHSGDHKVKQKEGEKRDRLLGKPIEYESNVDTKLISWLRTVTKGLQGLGNKMTRGDHQNTALLISAGILRKVLET